jgi:hypothetical protein
MKVLVANPPNIADIRAVLRPNETALFPWGNVVYNPSGHDIPLDIEIHEEVHLKQQAQWNGPEIWWTKYLTDPAFRLQQELEAYSVQYLWVKKEVGSKAAKLMLEEAGNNLSEMYNLGLNPQQASSKIRNYGRIRR